jgi:hypothetical protein
MQFLVQPQAADFQGRGVSLHWPNLANVQILDNELSITLRWLWSKTALVDSESADARFQC